MTYEESEQILLYCHQWRGLEEDEICKNCDGSGYAVYGSTALWGNGIGGQQMRRSVCDKCWGSGSKYKPWPSRI